MSKIDQIERKPEARSGKTLVFLISTGLVLALGRSWGLMDEYLALRFTLLSGLALWALLFLFPLTKRITLLPVDFFFLAYLLISYFSLAWAVLPSAGYLTIQTGFLAYVYYLGFRLLGNQAEGFCFPKGIATLSVLTLGIFFIQLFGAGLKEGLSGDAIYQIIGFSGHKNLLASFLFLLFGLTWYGGIRKPAPVWINALLAAQFIAIFLLRSRAVYLATFLFIVVQGLHWVIARKKKPVSPIWKSGLYWLMGAILAIGLFFALGATREDFKNLNPSGYFKSNTGSERLFVWYKTGQLIRDRWARGYGAGNWKIVFPSKSVEGSYRLQDQHIQFTRAHNDLLEIWTELGIIGLLAYLGIFGSAWIALFYSYPRSDPGQKPLIAVLTGLLAGYMVIAFFDFPKERMEHQVLLAFVLALSMGHSLPFFQSFRWSRPLSIRTSSGLMKSLAVLLGCNLMIAFFQIKGEYHTRKALNARIKSDWPLVESESRKAYSPLYQVNPSATSVKWLEGLAQYNQGKDQESLKTLGLAIRHTPFHFLLLNDYGATLARLNLMKEAIPVFEQAIKINPRYEEAIFNLAYVLAQSGRYDEAMDWLKKIKKDLVKKEEFLLEIGRMKVADQD